MSRRPPGSHCHSLQVIQASSRLHTSSQGRGLTGAAAGSESDLALSPEALPDSLSHPPSPDNPYCRGVESAAEERGRDGPTFVLGPFPLFGPVPGSFDPVRICVSSWASWGPMRNRGWGAVNRGRTRRRVGVLPGSAFSRGGCDIAKSDIVSEIFVSGALPAFCVSDGMDRPLCLVRGPRWLLRPVLGPRDPAEVSTVPGVPPLVPLRVRSGEGASPPAEDATNATEAPPPAVRPSPHAGCSVSTRPRPPRRNLEVTPAPRPDETYPRARDPHPRNKHLHDEQNRALPSARGVGVVGRSRTRRGGHSRVASAPRVCRSAGPSLSPHAKPFGLAPTRDRR